LVYQTILTKNADGVTTITLNDPEKRNALDERMSSELDDALARCEDDESVKAIVITGNGKSFCAGGDVKAMAEAEDARSFLDALSAGIHRPVARIWTMEKVVIAAVNGHAVGAGCSLAMACDLRYASKTAKFNMGFINVGLAPGCGTYFLPKLVGRAKAADMIYLSETINAEEAEKIGLVNNIFEPDDLTASVHDIATKIARGPTLAIGRSKTLLRLSEKSLLSDHLDAERHMVAISAETDDFVEGVNAFLEKRKPEFKGK